ncbi:hypothetical protein EV424DRAFT_686012 [Suillus variegatus]|nr:hypothetical protein EV424DRAFT_686012 [Suillus variegatus]
MPNSRHDFAAVVLATGEILIHGGGDGELKTTYSDGWILNTTQNTMVWQDVQSLQQLGARKDHLAIQCNGQVLFAFRYGTSAPASANMELYKPSSSSMVTLFHHRPNDKGGRYNTLEPCSLNALTLTPPPGNVVEHTPCLSFRSPLSQRVLHLYDVHEW